MQITFVAFQSLDPKYVCLNFLATKRKWNENINTRRTIFKYISILNVISRLNIRSFIHSFIIKEEKRKRLNYSSIHGFGGNAFFRIFPSRIVCRWKLTKNSPNTTNIILFTCKLYQSIVYSIEMAIHWTFHLVWIDAHSYAYVRCKHYEYFD